MVKAKTRVLIIDDSSIARQALAEVIKSDPQLEVMATASDPFVAADKLRREVPDVITLDVEMPRMDGLTFLRKLMNQHPIPVVMCSSLTEKGCATALKALEYGAVEFITKPKLGVQQFIEESRIIICDTIKAAARVKVRRTKTLKVRKKLTADAMLAKANSRAMIKTTDKVVVVGASTGGTEALVSFLSALPRNAPGIVVVQHMPEKFTASFAKRLNEICLVSIKEAETGDRVFQSRVLIAPGNKHTLLKRSGHRYLVEVKDGPLVCRHRPSVDVLFRSASRYAGQNAIGVIMTGMGDDGARGMKEMKERGAYNIAQDEKSCVVFGMPNEAIKHGGVDKVMPLLKIADQVLRQCT